jgi:MFS family permease
MHHLLSPFRQHNRLLNALFVSNVFISFHYALIVYINSSYLNNFFSETQVSALYIIGSIVNIIFLFNISKILEKIGVYKFTLYAIILELLSTIGMLLASHFSIAGLYFLIHLVSISLLLFSMDILLESAATDDSQTGSTRAAYLTLTNLTILFAPIVVAFLVIGKNYSLVYLLSSVAILPTYHFIKRFRSAHIKHVHHMEVRQALAEYIKDKNLYNIFCSQFLLQLFYAYMVVYTPLYLQKYIGFSWSEIGIMFTIMLLPFLLFELPVGEMEDEKYGEKEFLTIGFVIMAVSTLFISFVTAKVFWIWAAILFITRIGASFVEISTESYFFKQVDQSKTDVISFFRIARPLSFIVAPVLATLSLQFIPFQYLFITVGAFMIVGARYSLALDDTK